MSVSPWLSPNQTLIRFTIPTVPARDHLPLINFATAFTGGSDMAVNSVRVAVAQMTSINDLSFNFAACSRLVKEAVSAGAKLVCFPEDFSFMPAKDGEENPAYGYHLEASKKRDLMMNIFYNTHIIVDDSGTIRSTYRKIHLFDVDVPGGREYIKKAAIQRQLLQKETGEAHGKFFFVSCAIENQCYVIAAAQAGKANGKEKSYGDS
ncbi:Nitrilase-like protein 2 [Cucurbita argyrosperma subsp. argyrosperma]|nr:Nitrilase-like protein 2 [Cucurbita argyrosperma subsp. argyrosperma]